MKKKSELSESSSNPSMKAVTEEGREAQLISLAVNLAEKQLREGTASSQVITHYLKLGTERERLEREKLKYENQMIQAKTEAINESKIQQELYKEAIKAMRIYKGDSSNDEEL